MDAQPNAASAVAMATLACDSVIPATPLLSGAANVSAPIRAASS